MPNMGDLEDDLVTLCLSQPAGDGPWSTSALLEFDRAVTDRVHVVGYDLGPQVHLRNARLAQAG